MGKKITIIGGGSSTFTPQLMQLFLASKPLAGSTITLMDVDPHRLEVMDTLSKQIIKHSGGDLKIESTTDQRASLTGADFVIAAISVGGNDAWEKDLEIPATYGIYMPIADSIGPGGMMRAFRHNPVLAGVAKDVAQVAPDAWVFNYSNPLSSNVYAMRRAAPVRAVGLCTCSTIPRHREYMAHFLGIEPAEIAAPAPAAGLNHCAAVTALRAKDGRDLFPVLREKVTEPVTRWGLETFDVLPYCWSHWTEFYPSLRRLAEPYKGRYQGLKMTHNETAHNMDRERERSKHWEDLAKRLASGEEEYSTDVLPKDESVQVVEVMEALITGSNEIHAVNVPNQGAIPNLPADAIVEVSSVVGGYGIQPLQMPALPEAWAATLRQHITVQQLTAQAALSGDRKLALQAFLEDPNIQAALTVEETGKLLDELLKAHARYLPTFA